MDKKSIIGVLLCVVFYVAWMSYLQRKYPHMNQELTSNQENKEAPHSDEIVEGSAQNDQPQAPALKADAVQQPPQDEKKLSTVSDQPLPTLSDQETLFQNDVLSLRFAPNEPALTSIQLLQYTDRPASQKGAKPVELVTGDRFLVQAITNPSILMPRLGFHAVRQDRHIFYRRQTGGWFIEQELVLPQKGYQIPLKVRFKNISGQPLVLNTSLMAYENIRLPKTHSSFFTMGVGHYHKLIANIDGSLESEQTLGFCEGDEDVTLDFRNSVTHFAGIDQHYFLKLLLTDHKKYDLKFVKHSQRDEHCELAMVFSQPQGIIRADDTVELDFQLFLGPKDLDLLASVAPTLTSAVDLGWFGAIGKPLLAAIKFIYQYVGNYGVAIIILTIILKLMFYPLTRSAAVSMKNMQKYAPELNKIKERYKDDRARQQREVMQFMAEHKMNPAKGCLPILPQIPVFIAFYQVLSQSIELRHAPLGGWIHDLSEADPYYITPIILGVLMLVQQKLTPNPSVDKTQQRVMMMMPIFFTFMMLSLPAGMVLYMITNSLVSIVQQQWLNYKLDARASQKETPMVPTSVKSKTIES